MGSAQSILTPQNSAAAAILLLVAASALYSQSKRNNVSSHPNSKSGGRKGKKKRSAAGAQDGTSSTSDKEQRLTASSTRSGAVYERTVPGGIPEPAVETPQSEAAKPPKKRKGKKPATPTPSNTNLDRPPAAGTSSSAASSSVGRSQTQKRPLAGATEEPWTRVESRRRASTTSGQNAATSDAGVTTTSVTEEDGSSSGVLEKSGDGERETSRPQQKTLAEKVLPKGRKTAVDDMLESSHYPELSRVMRVVPTEDEQPASGFSWGDYEDVEDTRGADADGEDDGGWGVVKSRGKAKHSQISQNAIAAPQTKGPETLSKKQRQHAARREATKIGKAEVEADRVERLAKHKRDLERTRIEEQYSHKRGNVSSRSNAGGV